MKSGAQSPKSSHSPVGYCNPPQGTRFKKGQSGNPKGRPKGTLNMATVLERTLREKVVISENGKRKTVTKLEAAMNQLIQKAAMGDLKASQLLWSLVRSVEEREVQAPVCDSALDEVDERVVLGIMKRFESSRNENPVTEGQGNEANTAE
jgi:hypothetical protein